MSIREYWINNYPVREIRAQTAKTGYNKRGESTFIYDTEEGGTLDISYVLQPTGFGSKPLLVCPCCGSRHSKLYHAGGFVFCRTCQPSINMYHGIQNNTKGGNDYITYMEHRLAKQYGVDYFTVPDFRATEWIEEDYRPRYMRKATFADLIGRLQTLDELRCRTVWGKYMDRGKSAIDTQLLRYVCKAPPIALMEIDLYRECIELAEEVYRLPIIDRLLRE